MVWWQQHSGNEGVVAFAFLIALTGVWYLIEFFDVNLGYPELTPIEGKPADRTQPLDDVVANWPSLRITSVTPAQGNWLGPAVHVDGEGGAVLVRDRANYQVLDPANGTVLWRQGAADTADPAHFGNFAGLWSKVPGLPSAYCCRCCR